MNEKEKGRGLKKPIMFYRLTRWGKKEFWHILQGEKCQHLLVPLSIKVKSSIMVNVSSLVIVLRKITYFL